MIDRQREHPALIRCIQPMFNVPCPTPCFMGLFGDMYLCLIRENYGANNWYGMHTKQLTYSSHTAACVK